MATTVMMQHLGQEVNHLVGGDPLLVQGEQQVPTFADRRKSSHTSAPSGDLCLGGLSPRCPGFAQERCQRHVCLVLKIQKRPVFPHRFSNLGQSIVHPFLTRLVVRLEILTFRFLVRESRFAKPSPNRVFRDGDLQFLLNHLMDPPYGPQVCFVPEMCGRLKNKVPQPFALQLFQLTRPSTSCLPVQAIFTLLSISLYPPKQGGTVCVISLRNFPGRKAAPNDGLHRANPNIESRISSLTHGDRLSRQTPFESTPMLQIYCGGPYVQEARGLSEPA